MAFKISIFLFFILSFFAGAEELTIFVLGNENGVIAACNCPSHPYGGIAREVSFIKKTAKNNFITLNIGNFLGNIPDKKKYKYTLKAMKYLNYTGIALGEKDFVNGQEYLFKYGSELPFLASNLELKKDITKNILIKKNSSSFNICSYLSREAYIHISEKKDLNIKFSDKIPKIIDNSINILLLHAIDPEDRLLKKFSNLFDIIITSNSENGQFKKRKIDKAYIFSQNASGAYITIINIQHFKNQIKSAESRKILLSKKIPSDPTIEKLLNDYFKDLENIDSDIIIK